MVKELCEVEEIRESDRVMAVVLALKGLVEAELSLSSANWKKFGRKTAFL